MRVILLCPAVRSHTMSRVLVAPPVNPVGATVIMESGPREPQAPVEASHSAVRIQIEGRPSQTIDFHIDFMEDDKVDCSIIQTAMHTVNAIPGLVSAQAGVYGPDDLPVYSTKNLG